MPPERTVIVDARRPIPVATYFIFFGLIAAVLFLTHAPLLRLPFYWDELGQFVPASLDLYHSGAWVPYSTVPNIHPPGVMAYLAGFWSLAGYSVVSTRVAMLLLATLGALLTFLLAIQLGREASGFPAFTALLFLTLSPLFVAQAMLAQLDMPAMVLTCLALLLFLQDKMRRAALACVALVMVKETGILVPLVFGAWLWKEKRPADAALFAAPLVPLAIWLFVLHRATGHWAGNASFEQYNAVYNLHPLRLALAVVRRLYYLFLGSGHWAGTAAILYAWKKTKLFRTRAWAITAILAAGHVLMVSAFGGAVLERYLMPLLPLLYVAFAIALSALTGAWRLGATAALFVMLVAANFLNPLYPYPWENNLGFATFVSLDEHAADLVENSYPNGVIASVFPIAGALRRPEFGYVRHPMRVHEVGDYTIRGLTPLAAEPPDALIVYSTTWDPLHILENRWVRGMLRRFYGYQPQLTTAEIAQFLRMHSVARWETNGQWVEVLETEKPHH